MQYRNSGLNYGGFDGYPASDKMVHLSFLIYPVDLLQINFLFRDIDKVKEVSERFATMQISAIYRIEEVGTIRFAAFGNGGLAKNAADGDDIGRLHLAFYIK